jgi:hypothetical protein
MVNVAWDNVTTGSDTIPYTEWINMVSYIKGMVSTDRLGTGTADSTTYLRGDQTWVTISGGEPLYSAWILASNAIAGSATGSYSVAIGQSSVANQLNATAIGPGSAATGENSFSVLGTASGNSSISLGIASGASGTQAVAVGAGANATQDACLAFGAYPQATGYAAIALGAGTSSGNQSISIGVYNPQAIGDNSIAIGKAANVTGAQGIAIGNDSTATNTDTISIGNSGDASGDASIAIGYNTTSSALNSIAIGSSAVANQPKSFALGVSSQATALNAIAIGSDVTNAVANTINIGTNAEVGLTIDTDLNMTTLYDTLRLNPVTAPGTPATGQQYYDSGTNIMYYWNGTAWTAMSGGGGGGAPYTYQSSLEGAIYTTTFLYHIVNTAGTISEARATLGGLPTGANVKIDVRKNGNTSTDSIFNSDVPMEITTTHAVTNGVYTTTGGLDPLMTSVLVGDVLFVTITQVGSSISGADLRVQIKVA